MIELTILEERQYPSIKDIPYTFLRERLTQLSKEYPIEYIYISPKGNLAIDIEKKLPRVKIKSIFDSLIKPEDISKYPNDYYLDNYGFLNDGGIDYTQINLPKDIDYRTY